MDDWSARAGSILLRHRLRLHEAYRSVAIVAGAGAERAGDPFLDVRNRIRSVPRPRAVECHWSARRRELVTIAPGGAVDVLKSFAVDIQLAIRSA